MTFIFHSCKESEPSIPYIENIDVSSITASSAIINSRVISDGGAPVTSRGVYWSLYEHMGYSDTLVNKGTGIGEFTSRISGLKPSTIYYVVPFAMNSIGIGYGNNSKFKTSDTVYVSNYSIELDKEYRFSKVSTDSWTNTYTYSDKEVKITQTSALNNYVKISTYYLNTKGLADSSVSGYYKSYYYYNSDNYLISSVTSGKEITYKYLNGNRTGMFEGMPVATFYGYNSMLNLIDIESFTGPWLGRLNENLISEKFYGYGPMAMRGISYATDYQYVINRDGLVVQRIALKTYLRFYPDEKRIDNFEYKFVD